MSQAYDFIINSLQEQRFRDAEQLAIELVKQERLNPQGWVFLAEALLQQGFTDTAGKVFERAWLLDPKANWVPAVYKLLEVLQDQVPRFDIEALLKLPTVSVSAVIIVQDEGYLLQPCLASLHHAVDEMIIVDVSTSNQVRAIITDTSMTYNQYIDRRGETNLAAVKNDALELVTSDWVIFVTAKELLFRQDIEAIRHLAALYDRAYPPVILRVGHESIDDENLAQVAYRSGRMFPMGQGFRFWGHAYPQIGDGAGPHIEEVGLKLQRPVRIRFGYLDELLNEPPLVNKMQEEGQQLLTAARANLLKAKHLFATYRGAAKADQHIANQKADQLLSHISQLSQGDQHEQS